MWFQNRRAKYRKQEKQLAKSLNQSIGGQGSLGVVGDVMRNMYPGCGGMNRVTYPYSGTAGHQAMNGFTRYPQVGTIAHYILLII